MTRDYSPSPPQTIYFGLVPVNGSMTDAILGLTCPRNHVLDGVHGKGQFWGDMCPTIVTYLRMNALRGVRLLPRANVPVQRTRRTNANDNTAMRPFARLFWTLVRLSMNWLWVIQQTVLWQILVVQEPVPSVPGLTALVCEEGRWTLQVVMDGWQWLLVAVTQTVSVVQ